MIFTPTPIRCNTCLQETVKEAAYHCGLVDYKTPAERTWRCEGGKMFLAGKQVDRRTLLTALHGRHHLELIK